MLFKGISSTVRALGAYLGCCQHSDLLCKRNELGAQLRLCVSRTLQAGNHGPQRGYQVGMLLSLAGQDALQASICIVLNIYTYNNVISYSYIYSYMI